VKLSSFTKKITLFILFTITFNTINLKAQDFSFWRSISDSSTKEEFLTICDSVNEILFTHYSDSVNEEIKEYQRFRWFWKDRLSDDSSGIFYNYAQAILNNANDPVCDQPDDANWELIGPKSYGSQWMGLISEVLGDPGNIDDILIAPQGAGIWKKQTTGNTWANKTDALKLSGLSITAIVRNPLPDNGDHIIASIGANNLKYGTGIIESFDNGNTWQHMTEFPNDDLKSIVRLIVDPNDNYPDDGLTLYVVTGGKGGKIWKGNISIPDPPSGSSIQVSWDVIVIPPNMNMLFSQFHDIEIDKYGSIYVTACARYNQTNGFIMKKDAGSSVWHNINPSTGDFEKARITTPEDNTIIALVDRISIGFKREIYKSTDLGANWDLIYTFNGYTRKDEIELSPYTGDIFVGNLDLHRIYWSSGSNDYVCQDINQGHVDVRDIYFLGFD